MSRCENNETQRLPIAPGEKVTFDLAAYKRVPSARKRLVGSRVIKRVQKVVNSLIVCMNIRLQQQGIIVFFCCAVRLRQSHEQRESREHYLCEYSAYILCVFRKITAAKGAYENKTDRPA